MGQRFTSVQAEIWKEGKLVEIGGDRKPGIVIGLADESASTIRVMLGADVMEIMNPFWDGDIGTLDLSEDTVVSTIYLLDDDPYYELLTHMYENM